ncbi:MAG: hypothetical protein COB67_00215 [SAR324 cluster bacterium]|uniref:Uncharacterized protein n=1 Tax=SAR324 cluster bacterium TaxID=2024889 RepID=A0A2A4TBL4_9DELT|nr:MAG: hypothetical protein COB67_00215 [SAR324 cluster bacterium]
MKKILLLLAVFSAAVFGSTNPLDVMGATVLDEAESVVLPILIFWVLVFGAVMAFAMKTWMPIIFAIVVVVIFAMAPNLAVGFTDFFGTSTNLTATMPTPTP